MNHELKQLYDWFCANKLSLTMAVITRQLILFSDKDLVIILVECHEDAFIFKQSKYLPDMCMVTKVALVINILNFDS